MYSNMHKWSETKKTASSNFATTELDYAKSLRRRALPVDCTTLVYKKASCREGAVNCHLYVTQHRTNQKWVFEIEDSFT
jgi:hypothetical protein